ncbi:MAG TPA: hypothetical protein VEC12_13150 [Bacteroidia bacterium]|nr:hypothetical protein [Bacteroidia bacterium]
MRLFSAIILLTILVGCDPKQPIPGKGNKNDSPQALKDSGFKANFKDSMEDPFINHIEDTLQHLTKRKTFSINHPDNFYKIKGFTVDSNVFCVIITTAYFYVYKYSSEKFTRIYHEEYGALTFYSSANIKLQDLNWDGYVDINIRDNDQMPIHSTVLLYLSQTKTYKRTPYFDLTNLSIDDKNHLIRSHNQRGACWPAHKTLYRHTADSIELYKRVVCDPKCYKGDDIVITMYENKNGVIREDSIVGNPEKIWSLYNAMLWDLK